MARRGEDTAAEGGQQGTVSRAERGESSCRRKVESGRIGENGMALREREEELEVLRSQLLVGRVSSRRP